MSCAWRVKHGFTIEGILKRFPKLAAIMQDMEGGWIAAQDPAVAYARLEEVTFEIYRLYGLPATSVMPILQ
jgi:hypothetical protein